MSSSVDIPARLSPFRVFVCSIFSFPDMTSFRSSFPCPTQSNLIHTSETASLLFPVVFYLFGESTFQWHMSGMAVPWFYRILFAYLAFLCVPKLFPYPQKFLKPEAVRNILFSAVRYRKRPAKFQSWSGFSQPLKANVDKDPSDRPWTSSRSLPFHSLGYRKCRWTE
jgi:hypothetical protein